MERLQDAVQGLFFNSILLICFEFKPFFKYLDDDTGDNGALDNDDLLDEEAVLAVKIYSCVFISYIFI